MKSRVKGDFHARFCGKAGVKFPGLTRLWGILKDDIPNTDRIENHQVFFLTVLDRQSKLDNFVLTLWH
jgi:hypothetical protein